MYHQLEKVIQIAFNKLLMFTIHINCTSICKGFEVKFIIFLAFSYLNYFL